MCRHTGHLVKQKWPGQSKKKGEVHCRTLRHSKVMRMGKKGRIKCTTRYLLTRRWSMKCVPSTFAGENVVQGVTKWLVESAINNWIEGRITVSNEGCNVRCSIEPRGQLQTISGRKQFDSIIIYIIAFKEDDCILRGPKMAKVSSGPHSWGPAKWMPRKKMKGQIEMGKVHQSNGREVVQ